MLGGQVSSIQERRWPRVILVWERLNLGGAEPHCRSVQVSERQLALDALISQSR